MSKFSLRCCAQALRVPTCRSSFAGVTMRPCLRTVCFLPASCVAECGRRNYGFAGLLGDSAYVADRIGNQRCRIFSLPSDSRGAPWPGSKGAEARDTLGRTVSGEYWRSRSSPAYVTQSSDIFSTECLPAMRFPQRCGERGTRDTTFLRERSPNQIRPGG